LLRQYTAGKSDTAFGELVNRHIDLVFSAALRMTAGDRHLAEDVTQTVFTDLARKAATLPRDVVLPGWLYRHTCFTASKSIRTERRRQAREQIAMEMNALENLPEPGWDRIAPELEDAMSALNDADRDALVLRFSSGRISAPSARRSASAKTPRKNASAAPWKNSANYWARAELRFPPPRWARC
jgi:DNA-directed RNA polymerase specialized sigma24 family protein